MSINTETEGKKNNSQQITETEETQKNKGQKTMKSKKRWLKN